MFLFTEYISSSLSFFNGFFYKLFYLNRLLRAHFLAAEAADAFPVIIDRRVFSAVSEIHSFLRDRAALDADPAADTLV